MKTIVSIATKGDRPEQLKQTVNSLIKQCDELFIYDNSQRTDYTDLSKFYKLHELSEPCYYFSADDDIIYPDNYICSTLQFIKQYGSLITYHGRILKEPIKGYYKGHTIFDFKGAQHQASFVDVGGTGVMAFDTRYFNPVNIYKEPYKCMSDLVLSLEAKRHNKRIVCAPRKHNWLIQQSVKGSIMQMFTNNDRQQVELARQILE